jgi:hypothetical protein
VEALPFGRRFASWQPRRGVGDEEEGEGPGSGVCGPSEGGHDPAR